MKIAGIDFPIDLLNALRDGKLVVFAGAGVSRGEPARLPNFEHLAQMIAEGTGEALQDGETIDRFLGRLQHGHVRVHERAAEILSPEGLEPTELHRNLLRLYPDVGPVYVVTTNFDSLFEQAMEDAFGSMPEVFRAPALPLGRQFNGIVHLHGAVSTPTEMVITDENFGSAYMTEGWAARFLVELFSNFTILFVGYSYDDTIMRYLTRALPPRETDRRFALTQETGFNAQQWRLLEIEPITYPQPSAGDHSALDEGVRRLADLIQLGAVDWHREMTEIAENLPPLDEETVDLIEYGLTDDTRTRFFTEAATAPEWIDWLDERGYLNPLFLYGTLNERDRIFSWWLVKQFAHNHTNKLFRLIGKHNTCLHPVFWHDLSRQIGRDKEALWNTDILSRWISLLLATAQKSIDPHILLQLGERCIQHEMLDSLLQIFDTMMDSYFQLKGDFLLPYGDENSENTRFNVELPLIGMDYYVLNELWDEGLKPKLPQVAERLLDRVIRRLEDRYITLCTWHESHRKWDSESSRRSAIEPHEQDDYTEAMDVLIDAARDCLEWLGSNQADAAARWCSRLICFDAPLLRRLAVHGMSKREDLAADNKIDWLLTYIDLHDLSTHHEVFQAVRLAYPKATPEYRNAIIKAVWSYRWPNEEHPDKEEDTARQHFNWFDWLHQSDPNCGLARKALVEVSTKYPNFESREHPDLLYWTSITWGTSQSPWTPEQLLANPASNWLDDLLSFQATEWDGPDRRGLIENVTEAAKQDFEWGLDLADELGRLEEWDADLWSALIRAWSTMELDEDKYGKVLSWLGKVELHPKHNREIAEALYTLVKNDGPAYVFNILPQANKIAVILWHHLDQINPIKGRTDWLTQAINHPAGSLTRFWLFGLSLWLKQQDPKPAVLSDEYYTALSGIVRDQSLRGRLGRTILASQFAFLLAVDEKWTLEKLLPLFNPDNNDFYAAWDGFLGGRLNPAVAEVMTDPFLKAVEDLFNQRDRFIEYYIHMLAYLAEDPLDRWIPKLFQYASQECPSRTEAPMLFPRNLQGTKDCFAWEVGRRLQNMDEVEQREWWKRWLKRYWENRLQGMLGVLEASEIAYMLSWLPHLTAVFPEAVELAVQMPPEPLQKCRVILTLSKSDLWQKHPASVAELLMYLWECDLPEYSYLAQDLIDNLLSSDISEQLKEELEEIKVQLL